MRELPEDIIIEMKSRFGSDFKIAYKVLTEHVTENEDVFADRIIRCVIFISEGSIDRFKSYLKAAILDPRDVMWWAEYEKPIKATDRTKRLRDFNKPFNESSFI